MESNKKIFTKKNIIIGICILIVLIITVLMLIKPNNNNKERILSCNYSIEQKDFINISIHFDAYYLGSDNLDKMFIKLDNEVLTGDQETFTMLEQMMRNQYKDTKGMSVDISRKDNIVTLEYSIDYSNYNLNKDEIPNLGAITGEKQERNRELTIDELRENITKIGGVCFEK